MPFFLPLLAAAVAQPAISIDTLRTVTKERSSDAYEGRKPTAAAEPTMVANIVERMKVVGLKAGNHGR